MWRVNKENKWVFECASDDGKVRIQITQDPSASNMTVVRTLLAVVEKFAYASSQKTQILQQKEQALEAYQSKRNEIFNDTLSDNAKEPDMSFEDKVERCKQCMVELYQYRQDLNKRWAAICRDMK